MSKSEFRIGARLEVSRLLNQRELRYKSSIIDLTETDFTIQPPFLKTGELNLRTGESVEVELLGDRARLRFTTPVLKRLKEPLPAFVLRRPRPEDVRRIQLRQFVRVPLVQEVRYRLAEPGTSPWREGMSLDLSGGGMRFLTADRLAPGTRVLVALELPLEGVKVTLPALVKRSEPGPEGTGQFQLGLAWDGISERERDLIIKAVFQKQLNSGGR